MNKKWHMYGGIITAITIILNNYIEGIINDYGITVVFLIFSVFTPLIPDIDTEFGRHRGAMHNIFVMIILVFGGYYIGGNQFQFTSCVISHAIKSEIVFSIPMISLALLIGWINHVCIDMITKRGVMIFYPISKKSYGGLGLNSNSIIAKILTVIISIVIGLMI